MDEGGIVSVECGRENPGDVVLVRRCGGEDFINRCVEAKFTTPNRPPHGVSLVELRDWHAELAEVEKRYIAERHG